MEINKRFITVDGNHPICQATAVLQREILWGPQPGAIATSIDLIRQHPREKTGHLRGVPEVSMTIAHPADGRGRLISCAALLRVDP